jgi:hypothetical protein
MNTQSDQQTQNLYLYEQCNTSESYRSILEKSNASLQTTMDKHQPYHNRFDYELSEIRRGASNDRIQAETFRILNEKYEHHSKINTDGSEN